MIELRCARLRVLLVVGLVIVGVNLGLTNDATAGPHTASGIAGWVDAPGGGSMLNPELRTWASGVVDYSPAPGVVDLEAFPFTNPPTLIVNDDPTRALGPIGLTTAAETVSLGDLDAAQITAGAAPGSITLSFADPFGNGPGWDLAVFENAFGFFPPAADKVFAELAYVEVSTDGVNFARFPSVSLSTEDSLLIPNFGSGPLRDFAGIDPTDVHNLVGLDGSLIGTPLDLDDIAGVQQVLNGQVDPNNINFVRLVDIPGSGDFLDSLGNPILDAWVTVGNGGLDLDAVAGRYAVPEPSSLLLLVMGVVFGLGIRRRRSLQLRYTKSTLS